MPIDSEMHGRLTIAPPEEELQIYGPWNPGVESSLPSEFLPLSTVFSSANVSSSVDDVQELNGFCGLAIERLSTFRPERLALHEVLIRVMADLSVPDGEKYEDLGVNFRQMTATIMGKYILPELPEINCVFEQLKRQASDFIDKAQDAISTCNDDVSAARKPSWWRRFVPVRKKAEARTNTWTGANQDLVAIAGWRTKAQSIRDPFERAGYQAL